MKKAKKWIGFAVLLLFVFSLSYAGLGRAETSKFILMASTIGPIDAGIVATLLYADAKSAYTFIDRASFLSQKDQIKLQILVEGDEAMLNYITLIPVNPKKFSRANYEDAMTFVKWLTNPEKGQKIIRDFGRDKYGSPLFFPDSKEWREKQR